MIASFIGLDGVLGGWSSNFLLFWSVLVKLHKLGEIELGLLEDLDFPDHAAVVLEWEDLGAAFLLDLLANISFNQDFDEFFEVGLLNTGLHDLHHLLSDKLLLRGLGVAGGLHLTWRLLRESDGEHSYDVAVSGFGLDVRFNQRVPFLDHGAGMVPGDVHTMEVGVAIVSLDLVDLELQLSPGG